MRLQERGESLTQDEQQAGAAIEDLSATRSKAWLEAINTPAKPRPFKDPELMFLTRPQRLRLEHIVNSAYLRKQQKEKTASKVSAHATRGCLRCLGLF